MAQQQAISSFSIGSWEENPYREITGTARLTEAVVTQTYTGSLVGASEIRYLMLSPTEGVTTFTGIEFFSGALDGRDGAFGIRWNGEDDGTAARGTGSLIPSSGTDALAGIRGDASYEATRSGEITMSLRYDLD